MEDFMKAFVEAFMEASTAWYRESFHGSCYASMESSIASMEASTLPWKLPLLSGELPWKR